MERTMSRAPFFLPGGDNIVDSSHVLKKPFSLNNLLRGRQTKAKVKRLFGTVAVALLLLGSQLTACRSNGAPPPTAQTRPCCHLLVAQFSPTTTTNRLDKETFREGAEPAGTWTGLNTVSATAAFPTVDVAQAAAVGDLSAVLRESHEL